MAITRRQTPLNAPRLHRSYVSDASRTLRPRGLLIVGCASACIGAAQPAAAQYNWRVTPSIGAESTFTTNVNLDREKKSDWVNQLTPSVTFTENGAHSRINGSIALPVLLYARTSENNYVAPQANVNATFDAEHVLFLDASAVVSQQYLSPFGSRPTDLVTATNNRYTAQTYKISPYLKGQGPNDIDYELRQQNTWSNATNSTIANNGRSYTSEVLGHVTRAPVPTGWSFDYYRNDIKFEEQPKETIERTRANASFRAMDTLQLSAIAGYEDTRLIGLVEHGPTYGASLQWRPTDRTAADVTWEHRFFGAAYTATFAHRGPLWVWSLSALRDLQTYPQQLAALPQGGNISSLLNSLFSSRIPDPLARQTFVDEFIRVRGLPAELVNPLALFTEQVRLVESVQGSIGIVGARNTVFFNGYRFRDEPVPGSDLDRLFQTTPITQYGASAVWTHAFTSLVTLEASLAWTRANQSGAVTEITTDQSTAQAIIRTALTTLTSVYIGTRYQDLRSRTENANNTNEFAVFVGINHLFH